MERYHNTSFCVPFTSKNITSPITTSDFYCGYHLEPRVYYAPSYVQSTPQNVKNIYLGICISIIGMLITMFFGFATIKMNRAIITEQKQRIKDNMSVILEGMEIIKTGENIVDEQRNEYNFLEQKIVLNKNIIQMLDKQMNEWRNINMEKTNKDDDCDDDDDGDVINSDKMFIKDGVFFYV